MVVDAVFWVLMLERLVVVGGAIYTIYLGFKLFKSGLEGQGANLYFHCKGEKIELGTAASGMIFLVIGALVLIISCMSGVSVKVDGESAATHPAAVEEHAGDTEEHAGDIEEHADAEEAPAAPAECPFLPQRVYDAQAVVLDRLATALPAMNEAGENAELAWFAALSDEQKDLVLDALALSATLKLQFAENGYADMDDAAKQSALATVAMKLGLERGVYEADAAAQAKAEAPSAETEAEKVVEEAKEAVAEDVGEEPTEEATEAPAEETAHTQDAPAEEKAEAPAQGFDPALVLTRAAETRARLEEALPILAESVQNPDLQWYMALADDDKAAVLDSLAYSAVLKLILAEGAYAELNDALKEFLVNYVLIRVNLERGIMEAGAEEATDAEPAAEAPEEGAQETDEAAAETDETENAAPAAGEAIWLMKNSPNAE